MNIGTQKDDLTLAKELQKNLTKSTAKMVSLIKENPKDDSWEENGQTYIVIQTNSQNYHFMVRIPKLMAQGG